MTFFTDIARAELFSESESDLACYKINKSLKFSQFIFIWRETEMRDNLEHVLSEIHIGVTGKGTYFTVTMAVKQALYCVGWLSPCIHTVDDALIDFFDGWSSSGSTSRVTTSGTRHVWHTAWHTTTSTLVHLGDDWCADLFQFLLLVLEFVLNIKISTVEIRKSVFGVIFTFSAVWLLSNHLMASSQASQMVLTSSAEILSLTLSSSTVCFIWKA